MTTKQFAIETKDLGRSFKSYQKQAGLLGSLKGFWDRKYEEKIALKPTTIQIEPGQIVGLVGANGAGKTTLLKLLSGLVQPTSGSATILGFNPSQRPSALLRQISLLLGQKNQLWWDISPLDSYSLLAEIYDLEKTTAQKRVYELAEILDCVHVLKTQLRRLSLGERMKMEIIGALLHDPQILFLDEPTIGLDIVAQSSIRQFLTEYVKTKKPTIILTSHYMDDITKLADRLLLMSKGELVYDGTVEAFVKKSESRQKIFFSLENPMVETTKIQNWEFKKGEQNFTFEVSQKDVPTLLSHITQLNGVTNLKLEEADFESIIHTFLEKESRLFQTRHSH
jgi:ABC-2 type transport system ATP-binding protein